MKLMVAPAVTKDGIRYTVRRKGWFFWWFDAVCHWLPGKPRRVTEFFDRFDEPFLFRTPKDAFDWIKKEYGDSAEIIEWHGI